MQALLLRCRVAPPLLESGGFKSPRRRDRYNRNQVAYNVQPTIATKSSPSAVWRWAVLTAVSVAMFGNYYAYDAIGPVNAIYSFPNILMVLIGGVIVDRFGAARATLAFTVIQAIGALVTALSP